MARVNMCNCLFTFLLLSLSSALFAFSTVSLGKSIIRNSPENETGIEHHVCCPRRGPAGPRKSLSRYGIHNREHIHSMHTYLLQCAYTNPGRIVRSARSFIYIYLAQPSFHFRPQSEWYAGPGLVSSFYPPYDFVSANTQ